MSLRRIIKAPFSALNMLDDVVYALLGAALFVGLLSVPAYLLWTSGRLFLFWLYISMIIGTVLGIARDVRRRKFGIASKIVVYGWLGCVLLVALLEMSL